MLLIYLQVIQFDFTGRNCQYWNISYDRVTGEAIIFSYMHPHCALDVRSTGLYLGVYEEGKVSQMWIFKNDRFFNQGRVMTAFLTIPGDTTPIDTFPLSHFGSDDQKFYIMQKDNIKNPFPSQDERVYLDR